MTSTQQKSVDKGLGIQLAKPETTAGLLGQVRALSNVINKVYKASDHVGILNAQNGSGEKVRHESTGGRIYIHNISD